jgi:hypothetical protein
MRVAVAEFPAQGGLNAGQGELASARRKGNFDAIRLDAASVVILGHSFLVAIDAKGLDFGSWKASSLALATCLTASTCTDGDAKRWPCVFWEETTTLVSDLRAGIALRRRVGVGFLARGRAADASVKGYAPLRSAPAHRGGNCARICPKRDLLRYRWFVSGRPSAASRACPGRRTDRGLGPARATDPAGLVVGRRAVQGCQ